VLLPCSSGPKEQRKKSQTNETPNPLRTGYKPTANTSAQGPEVGGVYWSRSLLEAQGTGSCSTTGNKKYKKWSKKFYAGWENSVTNFRGCCQPTKFTENDPNRQASKFCSHHSPGSGLLKKQARGHFQAMGPGIRRRT